MDIVYIGMNTGIAGPNSNLDTESDSSNSEFGRPALAALSASFLASNWAKSRTQCGQCGSPEFAIRYISNLSF